MAMTKHFRNFSIKYDFRYMLSSNVDIFLSLKGAVDKKVLKISIRFLKIDYQAINANHRFL